MSNLMIHAKRELELAGWFDKDGPYDGLFGPAVMKMIEVFAEEGHSGMSAPVAVNLFKKLAMYEPLTPLTGEDDEWNDVSEHSAEPTWQNKRCSHVFKTKDGAYDIRGKVFREPDGSTWSNKNSTVPVTFPYTPTTEYVNVQNVEDAS